MKLINLSKKFIDRYRDIGCFFALGVIGYILGYFLITHKISVESWFWVHSAIAQSFAALIGLSAIFVFHAIGRIDIQQENIINKCKVFCSTFGRRNFLYYTSIYYPSASVPESTVNFLGIDDFRSIVKRMKDLNPKNSDEGKLEHQQFDFEVSHIENNINEYDKLQKFKENLKSKYLAPLQLSIIIIIWAILFLPRGQISGEWLNQNDIAWLTAIIVATSYTLGLVVGFLKRILTLKT